MIIIELLDPNKRVYIFSLQSNLKPILLMGHQDVGKKIGSHRALKIRCESNCNFSPRRKRY
jgi:hypothetical protein